MNPFKYLFYCSETIPGGLGFSLFGVGHLLWLGAIAAVCAAVCRCYRRSDGGKRLRIRRILSGLLIADELLKIAVLTATGCYTAEYLPLHMCSINIFICLWYTIHPNKAAGEILYALSLPGAVVALCVPTWVRLPFVNLMCFHSFSVHGMLFLYPFLLVTSGELRPDLRRLYIPAVFVLLVSPALYLFNCKMGTNFLFLNGTEENILLETIYRIAGRHLYILGLGCLLSAVWLLMYLPWGIRKRRA